MKRKSYLSFNCLVSAQSEHVYILIDNSNNNMIIYFFLKATDTRPHFVEWDDYSTVIIDEENDKRVAPFLENYEQIIIGIFQGHNYMYKCISIQNI